MNIFLKGIPIICSHIFWVISPAKCELNYPVIQTSRIPPVIISLSLFFFTLFIYLFTFCATFNINDSGETIMICDLLTVGHSPGYPLHALLGRLGCLFSLGQPMLRVTFFSMIAGSINPNQKEALDGLQQIKNK